MSFMGIENPLRTVIEARGTIDRGAVLEPAFSRRNRGDNCHPAKQSDTYRQQAYYSKPSYHYILYL